MINFSRRLHFLKAKERSTHIQDLQRRRRVGCICFFCDILHTKSRGIKKVVLMESFRSQPKSQVLQQQQQRGERKRRKKNIGLEDLLCTIATKYQGSSSLLSTARTGIFSARMRIEETGKSSRQTAAVVVDVLPLTLLFHLQFFSSYSQGTLGTIVVGI